MSNDLGKTIQDDKGAKRPGTDAPAKQDRSARTAGKDRDLDESGEAANQAHGHPREQRPGSDDAGHSEERMTEADRREQDLGGPGG